ncbi:MAG: hypothetical protein M1820_005269 [Bogoriella megaspora]|nr:MAG: hypothetical protein M1820_005269 [Bogoriella megaspora]
MDAEALPPHETRGPTILGTLWTFNILAGILVVLRAYVRAKTRATGWDDYIAYVALANITFGSISNWYQVHYGLGQHFVYVELMVSKFLQWSTIAQLQNAIAVLLIRISVCLFILRVIGTTHRKVNYFIWFLIVFMTLFCLATLLTVGMQCVPLRKAWYPTTPGHCINQEVLTKLTNAYGAIGCILDFTCVFIPVWIFRSLQMDRKTKIGLSAIICLGLITAACSLGKAITTNFISEDPTFDTVPVEIWAGMEANLGLCVACAPTLRHLFGIVVKHASQKGSYGSNSTPKTGQSTPHKFSNMFPSGLGSSSHTWHETGSNDGTSDMDERNLIHTGVKMGNIKVSRSLDVDYDTRREDDRTDVYKIPDLRV